MAKSEGPLFSLTASGSLKKTLMYQKRPAGQKIRKYHKPTGKPTAKQIARRRIIDFLVAQWQSMSDADKNTWRDNEDGKKLGITGYMYFLKLAQANLLEHTGLVTYLHCNEIVSGEVLDISGNENHGSLEPDFPTTNPTLTPSKSRKLDKALSYDGVDNYLEISESETLNDMDNFTIECWLYLNDFTSFAAPILGEDKISGEYSFLITLNNAQQIRTSVRTDEGEYVSQTTEQINATEWVHLTGTYDGTDLKTYINGKIKSDEEASGVMKTTDKIIIGKDSRAENRDIDGKIDEVCVYNRAMSATEILKRYNFANKQIKR